MFIAVRRKLKLQTFVCIYRNFPSFFHIKLREKKSCEDIEEEEKVKQKQHKKKNGMLKCIGREAGSQMNKYFPF